ELIVAMLAVLKTGAAYLPLDPANPRARLAEILLDSRASLLVTAGSLAMPEGGDCSRSEEHTSELQSRFDLVCRLLLEKKKVNHMLGWDHQDLRILVARTCKHLATWIHGHRILVYCVAPPVRLDIEVEP